MGVTTMADKDILIPDELDPDFSQDSSECNCDCGEYCRDNFHYISIDNFYERVTSLLNVGASGISQPEIDYPENAPAAERRMKMMIPNWKELDNEKFALFESCIVYMTCWILCPLANTRRAIKQTTPSLTLQFSSSSDERPCDRFFDLINDLFDEITGEIQEPFHGFRVTKSSDCKRRVIWPNRLPH